MKRVSVPDLEKLKPDDYKPKAKTYGKPEDVCSYCVEHDCKGFVRWDEIDENGYEGSIVYACMRYPCTLYKKEREASIERHINESGIPEKYKTKTVSSFIATTKETDILKTKVINYVMDGGNSWLYMGGQTGSGKTHLACAVGMKLLKEGKNVKFYSWNDLMREVKNFTYNRFEIAKIVEVLIIDDLFKGEPSPEEKKRTFELIDARMSKGLQTIITTEKSNREMIEIDSAVFGRIVEMTNGAFAFVSRDHSNNYRLRGIL